MIDPRTPMLVGSAQVIQRPGVSDNGAVLGPIELMTEACTAAAIDAGAAKLLKQVDWVAVVAGWWRYRNPGQLVAAAIGSPDAHTALSMPSGSAPQELIGIAAGRIARGELDVAVVLGGEARWTSRRLKS